MAEPVPASVEASLFEGLFNRALKPEGEFAAALVRVGFNPADLQPKYPAQVWYQALEVARAHTYPALPKEEGFRKLGYRFTEGFFQTIIGRVLSAAMPLMRTEALIKLSPRQFRATRKDIEVTPVKDAERRWRIRFVQPFCNPDFTAGLTEAATRRNGSTVKVVVTARAEHGFELLLTW